MIVIFSAVDNLLKLDRITSWMDQAIKEQPAACLTLSNDAAIDRNTPKVDFSISSETVAKVLKRERFRIRI